MLSICVPFLRFSENIKSFQQQRVCCERRYAVKVCFAITAKQGNACNTSFVHEYWKEGNAFSLLLIYVLSRCDQGNDFVV